MDQSPWRFNGTPSSSQEIPCNFWNLQFHDLIHWNPPLFHILNQLNLFHALPLYVFKTFFNIIPSTPWSSKWSFSFSILHQNTVCISRLSHLRETCHVYVSFISLYLCFIETTSINTCRYAVSFGAQFFHRLYGEVNSVEKHNYKIWLNDGVY